MSPYLKKPNNNQKITYVNNLDDIHHEDSEGQQFKAGPSPFTTDHHKALLSVLPQSSRPSSSNIQHFKSIINNYSSILTTPSLIDINNS